MCGIIYYRGKEKSLADLFNLMVEQRSRGDEDGMGFYDFSKGVLEKTTLKFDEILKGKIDKERYAEKMIPQKIKKTKTKVKKEYIKQIKKEWNNELRKWQELLTHQTNEALFHHRKASSGWISTENSQPYWDEENRKLYAHNGTCRGADAVREFMKEFDNTKFDTEVDTEVLKNLYLKFEGKIQNNEILTKLSKFFDFGVFFISDLNKHLVFLDGKRTLYKYQLVDDGTLLISEPSFQVKKFKECQFLQEGVGRIVNGTFSFEGKMVDVTDKLRKKVKEKHRNRKCDTCRTIKQTFEVGVEDVCLDCWCRNKFKAEKVLNNSFYGLDRYVTEVYRNGKRYFV